jgi:hypothetical protein
MPASVCRNIKQVMLATVHLHLSKSMQAYASQSPTSLSIFFSYFFNVEQLENICTIYPLLIA